eukprot:gene6534-7567_t
MTDKIFFTNNVVKDHSIYLSKRCKARQPSPIRELMKYTTMPDVISLGGGLPNPQTFPFQTMTITLKSNETITLEGADLATALQYSPSYGLPRFTAWLKQLQSHVHSLPLCNTDQGKQWNLGVTTGSQEALALAADAFLNEGDSIITEDPTYSGTLSILLPLGLNIVGVGVDGNGMIASQFEETLANWETRQPGKPFPKILYTIPTGQNPSGCTMTVERKAQIYQICSRYNMLILEDDPYYYLSFSGELGQSMLSMDGEGRVVRFDSLSKILSSGLRLGFYTGPTSLVERIQITQQASTLHASGVSQTIALKLLELWGIEGFYKHLSSVQSFYKQRRDVFVSYVRQHLSDLVDFDEPSAGMFLWMRLRGIKDTYSLISAKALEKKVVLVPGIAFHPDQLTPSPFVRASFSVASDSAMEEACKRIALLIKENQDL